MQYTLRNVSKELDAAVRRRAAREKRSLNDVVLRAIAEGLGVASADAPRRSFAALVGAAPRDRALAVALEAQRTIDPELWR